MFSLPIMILDTHNICVYLITYMSTRMHAHHTTHIHIDAQSVHTHEVEAVRLCDIGAQMRATVSYIHI